MLYLNVHKIQINGQKGKTKQPFIHKHAKPISCFAISTQKYSKSNSKSKKSHFLMENLDGFLAISR
jgi:hypothetical protein